jgi:hypothetical protein
MPVTKTPAVQEIRTAHAVIAGSCASINQNSTPDETATGPALPPSASELSPQQNLAIGHLIAGRSYTETASLVKISRITLYLWRKNPTFNARLCEASEEALEAVAMRTRNLLLRGTARLETCIENSAKFGDVLRLVSNKRVWDMANVMPREIGPVGDTEERASANEGRGLSA